MQKKSKYNNIRCEVDGIKFMSIGESECYALLKLTMKAQGSKILRIDHQVPVQLVSGFKCVLDFRVIHHDGTYVYVDYKGCETPRWQDIKRLWRYHGPAPLHVYKGRGFSLKLVEEILPIKEGALDDKTDTNANQARRGKIKALSVH